MNRPIITVFTGGRGTKYIQQALAGTNVKVNYLINGYDSGKSTGLARKKIPGLLGPSDYRKCISNILAFGDAQSRGLAEILENRDLLRDEFFYKVIDKELSSIDYERGKYIMDLVAFSFSKHLFTNVEFEDFALGNLIICAEFMRLGNFNEAIDVISKKLLKNENVNIINPTLGEDLWLGAKTKSLITFEESVIVGEPAPEPIEELFLIDRKLYLQSFVERNGWTSLSEENLKLIEKHKVKPALSSEAQISIETANLIIFGSGTQHSSIYPTFLTENLNQTIWQNVDCKKVIFVNGQRDKDFASSEHLEDSLKKFQSYSNATDLNVNISQIYIPNKDWDGGNPTNLDDFSNIHRIDTVDLTQNYNELHAFENITSILKQILGHEISSKDEVISLIFPILNEYQKVEQFIQALSDLPNIQGYTLEKIVIDGGSTDGTYQLLSEVQGIFLAQTKFNNPNGRFSAIYKGISLSRGSNVLIFPSDMEYSFNDIPRLVFDIINSNSSVILGSRTNGLLSSIELRRVYGKNTLLYWLSRIGGLLTSFILSLRLGQQIQDPFSVVFGGKRADLLELIPESGDIDGYIKFIKNSVLKKFKIRQVDLSYTPRNKFDGKKTNFKMGLSALFESLS